MKAFAELLDRLAFAPQRNTKLALMADYFATRPDPERGWALAALAGTLELKSAKAAMLRELIAARTDPELFALSYDYVGDLAETIALMWPEKPSNRPPPELPEVIEEIRQAPRGEVPELIARWLDVLGPSERFALLKLLTGGFRVGVSARLAKTALAEIGAASVEEIEEVWHGLTAPYEPLFAWLDGKAGPPEIDAIGVFRPLMLANPIEAREHGLIVPEDFAAEWKWDGIRVQLAAGHDAVRLYSRTGDDISGAFPDIVGAVEFTGVFDGELLVARNGEVAPFNELQQRLGRKQVSAKMRERYPAHIRLYDVLFVGEDDLRGLTFDQRRARLEAWYRAHLPDRFDLSPLVSYTELGDLTALLEAARESEREGLMLKRRDSAYVAGRPRGLWYKWKRDPLLADCVLMYAQRGHGKRSSFYSDFTFGCWREDEAGGEELVPVGKAYFGFTDDELKQLDKWVRDHTVDRFGPVRAVEFALVFEVAFDAVQVSKRHKSGLAMRFPRISRIRWDKPAAEADRVATLAKLAG